MSFFPSLCPSLPPSLPPPPLPSPPLPLSAPPLPATPSLDNTADVVMDRFTVNLGSFGSDQGIRYGGGVLFCEEWGYMVVLISACCA